MSAVEDPTTTENQAHVVDLLAQLDQAAGENVALQARIAGLAAFQQEAIGLRAAVEKLQAELTDAAGERDAAVQAAARATAALTDATSSSGTDQDLVARARNLAAALKAFS